MDSDFFGDSDYDDSEISVSPTNINSSAFDLFVNGSFHDITEASITPFTTQFDEEIEPELLLELDE